MKKVQVIWTDESLNDLEIIYDFLFEKSAKIAERTVESILSRTGQLETFPESGAPQETSDESSRFYRYLVEGHYKIIYSMDGNGNALYIETVVDTRQNPESYKL